MDHFICDFHGLPVKVWYESTRDCEIAWIAHFELQGVMQSLDGTIVHQEDPAQAEIEESVLRALRWAVDARCRDICKR